MKETQTITNPKGKWVEKKTISAILICKCGAKYIKTRRLQEKCLKCVFENEPKRSE